MAGGSSRLYRQRKLRALIPGLVARPTFRMGVLPYHFRPHVTLPELQEEANRVYIPPPPPTPPYMVWDTGIPWDSGWKWK